MRCIFYTILFVFRPYVPTQVDCASMSSHIAYPFFDVTEPDVCKKAIYLFGAVHISQPKPFLYLILNRFVKGDSSCLGLIDVMKKQFIYTIQGCETDKLVEWYFKTIW